MKITRYQLSDEWETYMDNDVSDSKFENEEFVKLSDIKQLQKDINWELQHHIKGEYTIYQTKRRIIKIFNNFKYNPNTCPVCHKIIFKGETIIKTNLGECHSGCIDLTRS